jgi:hypothetical protein
MRGYGVNIVPQVNADNCIAYLRRLRPAWVVVMDEYGLAVRIRREVPGVGVIFRRYAAGEAEKDWHRRVTAEQWLAARGGDATDGIVLQVFNEPNGYEDLRGLAAWCADLMRRARAQGIRLALPGWGLGHPEEARIARGELDVMLREFGDCEAADGHVLMVHEYAVKSMREERPFHIGRYRYTLARMTALGLPLPTVVIGEHGRDVRGTPGVEGDGWQRVMTDGQYTAFLQAGEDAYAGVARCLFCYTDGNADWATFNVADRAEVLAWMVERNGEREALTPRPPLPHVRCAHGGEGEKEEKGDEGRREEEEREKEEGEGEGEGEEACRVDEMVEMIMRRLEMGALEKRMPIVGPILLALRSRKVIVALVSILVAVLVAYVPELRAVQDALIVLIGSLALAVIGGIAWEDAAGAARERAAQPVGTIAEEVKRAVREVLEEGEGKR